MKKRVLLVLLLLFSFVLVLSSCQTESENTKKHFDEITIPSYDEDYSEKRAVEILSPALDKTKALEYFDLDIKVTNNYLMAHDYYTVKADCSDGKYIMSCDILSGDAYYGDSSEKVCYKDGVFYRESLAKTKFKEESTFSENYSAAMYVNRFYDMDISDEGLKVEKITEDPQGGYTVKYSLSSSETTVEKVAKSAYDSFLSYLYPVLSGYGIGTEDYHITFTIDANGYVSSVRIEFSIVYSIESEKYIITFTLTEPGKEGSIEIPDDLDEYEDDAYVLIYDALERSVSSDYYRIDINTSAYYSDGTSGTTDFRSVYDFDVYGVGTDDEKCYESLDYISSTEEQKIKMYYSDGYQYYDTENEKVKYKNPEKYSAEKEDIVCSIQNVAMQILSYPIEIVKNDGYTEIIFAPDEEGLAELAKNDMEGMEVPEGVTLSGYEYRECLIKARIDKQGYLVSFFVNIEYSVSADFEGEPMNVEYLNKFDCVIDSIGIPFEITEVADPESYAEE